MAAYVSNAEALQCEFWRCFFDKGDTDESVREKFRRLSSGQRFYQACSMVELRFLSSEQRVVATSILDSIRHGPKQLFFLQGAAGTGKTFTVKAIISEMRRLGKRCLVSATTGFAAVQYPGGVTVHSLFKLGIDEAVKGEFRCNIGQGTPHARYICGADLVIIDEVSMLTPLVANRVSLTLQAICGNEEDFGGMKILFVGDLLQLPPVCKGAVNGITARLIVRMHCWDKIWKFRLSTSVRTANREWADFLQEISYGLTGGYEKWSKLAEHFGVTVTSDYQIAEKFFCDGLSPADRFPLDRQWICATNMLASEVNKRIQSWRATSARFLGSIDAATELVTPLPESPGLSHCQQLDFLERIDAPDLPLNTISLYAGDALVLVRNLDTSLGLAKGRRCSARNIRHRTVVVDFDGGDARTLTRMPMEKVTNGMRFKRWQVPLRLMFAGTVHRSQGMTLSRTVIDCRSAFWEHGQLYVALSRGRNPRDICVLLPPDSEDPSIKVPVDLDVVEVVKNMCSAGKFEGEAHDGLDATCDIDSTMEFLDDSFSFEEYDDGIGEHRHLDGDVLDNDWAFAVGANLGDRVSFVPVEVTGGTVAQITDLAERDLNSVVGVGLVNRDGSCYVNAFLQILFHLREFRLFLSSLNVNQGLAGELRLLFSQMSQGLLICPADLGRIVEPDHEGDKDCCEFGVSLLTRILAGLGIPGREVLLEMMFFHIVRIVSVFDEEETILEGPEMMLGVCCDWGGSLRLAMETLFGPRQCLARRDCTEIMRLAKGPSVLFIQINRISFVNGRPVKDCRCFVFQSVLDLGAYVAAQDGSAIYDLCSVVAHIGIPAHGVCHYIAFCKIDGEWYCFNDRHVEQVTLQDVLDENFPSDHGSNQTGVLLVYKRR
jgi:hypothetical protein